MPIVSVLMTVFNGERWLSEAIQSVLGQSFTDFEFIIVNDGSCDGSFKLINLFADQDPRIRVFDKPNTGLSDSLNYGLARACGEWIARIDADDICESDRLERQIALAQSNSEIVFVGTGLTIINETGSKLATYLYPTTHYRLSRNLLFLKKFPAHSSALYKTSMVRELGGYRVRFKSSEDLDLWLRLYNMGEFRSIGAPLVRYRKHDKQISLDEFGRKILLYARIAHVSFWVRQLGHSDPVDGSEYQFNCFVSWMRYKLVKHNVYKNHERLFLIQSKVANSPSFLVNIPYLFFNFLLHPIFLIFFIKRFFFVDLQARRLALEWLKLEKPHI